MRSPESVSAPVPPPALSRMLPPVPVPLDAVIPATETALAPAASMSTVPPMPLVLPTELMAPARFTPVAPSMVTVPPALVAAGPSVVMLPAAMLVTIPAAEFRITACPGADSAAFTAMSPAEFWMSSVPLSDVTM